MGQHLLRSALQGAGVLALTTVVVFGLVRLTGDPAAILLPPDATADQVATVRRTLGLDAPIPLQYARWIGDLLHGDLGYSYRLGVPVTQVIEERLPNTIRLATGAFVFSLLIGFPLGVLSALRRGRPLDLAAKIIAFVGISAPSFWVGIVIVLLFSVDLHWLPTSGTDGPLSYVMPVFTLGFTSLLGGVVRVTRSALLDVLDADYLTVARMKGLPERRVITTHALRNAALPVITYVGFYFSLFLSGSVVVEALFRWPGIGLLSYESVLARDFPLLQGILLVAVAWVIITNLLIDLVYAWVDPRIRY